jgi:hypothetical protein
MVEKKGFVPESHVKKRGSTQQDHCENGVGMNDTKMQRDEHITQSITYFLGPFYTLFAFTIPFTRNYDTRVGLAAYSHEPSPYVKEPR